MKITRQEAIPIIKAAYDAGTLPAQNGITGTYYRELRGKVVRCAIGVLFTPEEARKLEGNGPDIGTYQMVSQLIKNGVLEVDDPTWFIRVQGLHDDWADATVGAPGAPGSPKDWEEKFLEALK